MLVDFLNKRVLFLFNLLCKIDNVISMFLGKESLKLFIIDRLLLKELLMILF